MFFFVLITFDKLCFMKAINEECPCIFVSNKKGLDGTTTYRLHVYVKHVFDANYIIQKIAAIKELNNNSYSDLILKKLKDHNTIIDTDNFTKLFKEKYTGIDHIFFVYLVNYQLELWTQFISELNNPDMTKLGSYLSRLNKMRYYEKNIDKIGNLVTEYDNFVQPLAVDSQPMAVAQPMAVDSQPMAVDSQPAESLYQQLKNYCNTLMTKFNEIYYKNIGFGTPFNRLLSVFTYSKQQLLTGGVNEAETNLLKYKFDIHTMYFYTSRNENCDFVKIKGRSYTIDNINNMRETKSKQSHLSQRSRAIVQFAGMVSSASDSTKRAIELNEAQSILDDAILLSDLIEQLLNPTTLKIDELQKLQSKIYDVAFSLKFKAVANSIISINSKTNIDKLMTKLEYFLRTNEVFIQKQMKLIDVLKRNSNTITYNSIESFLYQFDVSELDVMIEYHKLLYNKYRVEYFISEFSNLFTLPDDCPLFIKLNDINEQINSFFIEKEQSGGGGDEVNILVKNYDIINVLHNSNNDFLNTGNIISSYIQAYFKFVDKRNDSTLGELNKFLNNINTNNKSNIVLSMYKHCFDNNNGDDTDIFEYIHNLLDRELYDQLNLNNKTILDVFKTDDTKVIEKFHKLSYMDLDTFFDTHSKEIMMSFTSFTSVNKLLASLEVKSSSSTSSRPHSSHSMSQDSAHSFPSSHISSQGSLKVEGSQKQLTERERERKRSLPLSLSPSQSPSPSPPREKRGGFNQSFFKNSRKMPSHHTCSGKTKLPYHYDKDATSVNLCLRFLKGKSLRRKLLKKK